MIKFISRILNLANNSISKIDELTNLTKLTELNLKINQVRSIINYKID